MTPTPQTERLLHLLSSGDLSAWPPLARDLSRKPDPEAAARALTHLDAGRLTDAAAPWLARLLSDASPLAPALLTLATRWPPSPRRALAQDLLSGAYRLIPPGEQTLGPRPHDPDPGRLGKTAPRLVEITRPLLVKVEPITHSEWSRLTDAEPHGHPWSRISWYEALALCNRLSDAAGLAPAYALDIQRGTLGGNLHLVGQIADLDIFQAHYHLHGLGAPGYRLPTEAEWEHCLRALPPVEARRSRDTPSDAIDPDPADLWEWCWDSYRRQTPRLTLARDPCSPPDGHRGQVARCSARMRARVAGSPLLSRYALRPVRALNLPPAAALM